jgi:pyruvate dehydrogenase E1 component alpha subunit
MRTSEADSITPERRVAYQRLMLVIRRFEQMVQKLYEEGLVHGSTHLCEGQEAVAVGVAAAMRPGDYSTYTYRGHGHALARGMVPAAALAEILGRSTGVNGGKGGSMHLTDARLGLMGSFAIVGAGLPVAVGLGKASQLSQDGRVSVTFFGDGATNIGAFHEAMNLAAVWSAPVVFVCENNLYGEFSRYDETSRIENFADRALGYGMESSIVDGNDLDAVFDAARAAIRRARTGQGPTFIECKTYRHRGHSRSDSGDYRPAQEVTDWLARDPIALNRLKIRSLGWSEATLVDLDDNVAEAIEEAVVIAKAGPWPNERALTEDVYARE